MYLDYFESPFDRANRVCGKCDNLDHYQIDVFICEKNLSDLVAYANIKFGCRWMLKFNEVCYNKVKEIHEINLALKTTCLYSWDRVETQKFFSVSLLNEIKLKILEHYFKKKYGKSFQLSPKQNSRNEC